MDILLALLGILLSLVLWVLSPEPWQRRTRQFVSWVFRRHPAVAAMPDIAAFEGRVEILTEELLSHPADGTRRQQYYEMAPLDWDIIAASADIERDQQTALVMELGKPSSSLRFLCIRGEPGSGKSTLAWRVAAEAYRRNRALFIRVKDKEAAEVWYRMTDFCHRVGRPVFVIADDLFRNTEVCRALSELSPWLPLTVLATCQSNEYRIERLKGQVIPVPLGPPTKEEKERVLRRLGKDPRTLSAEQLDRMKAANEFLVLMVELTSGKGFQEVVEVSLQNLLKSHESVYHAYEYLCFSYSYVVAVPNSLLERLDGEGRFQDLPNQQGAQGLIFYDESRPDLVRPGHPKRAEAARRLFERARSSESVLEELVNVVDITNHSERRFVGHLLTRMAYKSNDLLRKSFPHIEGKVQGCLEQATRIREFTMWSSLYLKLDRPDVAAGCIDSALTVPLLSATDCNLAVSLFRERSREAEALPILDHWVHGHSEWGGVGPAYLALVERYGSETDRERATNETAAWLLLHPDDTYVRVAYLGLVERRGTSNQTALVMESTRDWLVRHSEDSAVRTAYLGLVERKGTAEQTERVLGETGSWLATHSEDRYVRTAYLGFVERKGTVDQRERVLENSGSWLTIHSENSDFRTAYLGFVERKATVKQAERAMQVFRAWLRANPDSNDGWEWLISYLCRHERFDDARAVAQEALALHPTDHNLLHHYLKLMNEGLDETRARQLYDSLVKMLPRDPTIKNEWARWLHTHGHREEAETVFKALIAASPKVVSHLYGFGRMLLEMERYGEAEAHFRRVLAIHRGHAMAHDGLAVALHGLMRRAEKAGNHSEAATLLSAADRELLRFAKVIE